MPPDGGSDARVSGGVDQSRPKDKEAKSAADRPAKKTTITSRLPIKDAVKLLVFLDMLSVALVVPLLSAYFRDLNISTEQYGLMSSAYSLAQIVGGVVLGALSDRAMSRRSVLLISFLGSSASYGAIGLSSSLAMLLVGRVVVGLVKQTMTISTAIVSEHTTTEDRSAELSKLTAAMTFSFIAGPAMGSLLYQKNKKLPPLVASGLFLVNSALALILLPSERPKTATGQGGDNGVTDPLLAGTAGGSDHVSKASAPAAASVTSSGSAESPFCANVKLACSSGPTIRILVAKLMYGFFMRSLAAQNFVGYFEERFDVESWAMGYITSYTAGVSFIVQLYVVGRLTSRFSEVGLVWAALAVSTLMNFAEGARSVFGLRGYLALIVPARAVANGALGACLQSIFTQRVPQSDIGAALGTLNVLLSASGVVGPIYGGKLMGALGVLARPTVTAAHYAVFFVVWWGMEIRGVRSSGKTPRKTAGGSVQWGSGRVGAGGGDDESSAHRRKVE